MNATSLTELRQTMAQPAGQDQRMEQVRQLLIGDAMQDLEARLSAVETSLRELDTGVAAKLEAISARIDTLSGEMESTRRSAFEQLSKSLLELSEQVRGISKV